MTTEQFKPNSTVAAIIHHNGKFLMVEEIDDGKVVYNQPAGHVESNESILDALSREVYEETGLAVQAQSISGIYYHYREDLNLYYLRFCFVVELDQFASTNPQDDDIIQAMWLNYEDIIDKGAQLRSPLVIECLDDYLQGKRYPLELIKSNIGAG